MRGRLLFLLLVFTLSGSLGLGVSVAQSPDFIYSETKGHTISGAFLEYYLRAHDPKAVYGEPITEAFTDPKTNLLVQYFEKARFEFHPTAPTGRQVQMTPLGHKLYLLSREQALPAVFATSQGCRVFPDSGYQVCQAFLAFYKENGGEYTFGPPVSNAVYLNGRLVQYFFYSKLEWHPDLPRGKSIVIADLGYEFFHENKEDSSRLAPIHLSDENSIIASILSLHPKAITQQAITSTQGRQTIDILVKDQRGLPVPGTQAIVIVRLPSGEENRFIVPQLTDQNGITHFSFTFDSDRVGMAEIEIIVTSDGRQAKTRTSFRIWW